MAVADTISTTKVADPEPETVPKDGGDDAGVVDKDSTAGVADKKEDAAGDVDKKEETAEPKEGTTNKETIKETSNEDTAGVADKKELLVSESEGPTKDAVADETAGDETKDTKDTETTDQETGKEDKKRPSPTKDDGAPAKKQA